MDMDTHTHITNRVAAFFSAVDEQGWEPLAAMMTTPIHFDYSSFGAGDPADRSPADILDTWRGLLPGFDHTHHQLGNLHVELVGERAHVGAYVIGHHVIGDEIWTVVGRYEIELARGGADWQLASLRFVYRYQTGATDLPGKASERASTV